ncbi:MAG: SSS family solute:Na+ symporter, partial [Chlamydiales bacterium]
PELEWFSAHVGWDPLVTSVLVIGVVAVVWTWMGGIAAVVWTDVFLFMLFIVGIGVSLWVVHDRVSGGLGAALSDGLAAGKFRFFDTRWDPTRAYTIWVACIAAPWGNIGPYGTDQLITQRLLCCKNAIDARRAMLWSTLSIVITFAVAIVGVGLWAFYREHPLTGDLAASVASQPDRVFPVFISTSIPTGLRGLVIAGAFAAAISSLDSILAALSQTSMSTFVLPLRRRLGRAAEREPGVRETLFLSRTCVLIWGVLLCAAAIGMSWIADRYDSLLDLALAMMGYTGGALLAAFFLAYLGPRRGASGFVWSAPLSILVVFALVWHAPWALWVCWAGLACLALAWILLRLRPLWVQPALRLALVLQSLALLVGFGVVIGLWRYATFDGDRVIAFPWYIPCGSLVAFLFALVLDRRSFLADE